MASRKVNRKSNRKSRRNRKYHGGMAPLNWSNPGPMTQNLAQGVDFARYHVGQHGGMAPYPGGVVGSMLPGDLADSARVTPTLQAYSQIKGLQDGGRKRRGSRRQYGGVLVPWGGRRRSRRRNRSRHHSRHRMRGGAGINMAVDSAMLVPDSSKMLIPSSMVQQAGLHREWADAANPRSMMPN
jgi:hypothetical protein